MRRFFVYLWMCFLMLSMAKAQQQIDTALYVSSATDKYKPSNVFNANSEDYKQAMTKLRALYKADSLSLLWVDGAVRVSFALPKNTASQDNTKVTSVTEIKRDNDNPTIKKKGKKMSQYSGLNTGDKFLNQSWGAMCKQQGVGKKVLLIYSTMDSLTLWRPKYRFYEGDIASGLLTEYKETFKGLKFKNNTTLLKDVLEKWGSLARRSATSTVQITADQLKEVFKGTDPKRLAEVVAVVNKYGDDFGITSPQRMSHFLAQTGYESGGFKEAKGESGCYTSGNEAGWDIWFTKTWAEPPFKQNCDPTLLPFSKGSKKLPWKVIGDVPNIYVCGKSNLRGEALTKKLFSYVYQCEGGNGDANSADGYKYRGHGAIQLIWKKTYEAFASWLKKNAPEKYKDIIADPTLIDSDIDLFMLSAMWFWGDRGLNKVADSGGTAKEINEKVTYKINSKGERKEELGKLQQTLNSIIQ